MRRFSVLMCVVVMTALAAAPAWAQLSADPQTGPSASVTGVRGAMVKFMAADTSDVSTSMVVYPNEATNTLVSKVFNGPVVATWTGELLGMTAASDVVIGIFAEECLNGVSCSILGPSILSFPNVEGLRNYSLVVLNSGFSAGTLTVTTVWPTGTFRPNRYHKFTAFVGQSSAAEGTLRLRTLKIEAHAKLGG